MSVLMSPSTSESWTRRFHSSPGPARLVCFPHAGGAATVYFELSKVLAPRLQVVAVQYPGRQDRMAQPPLTAIEDLAAPVADLLAGEDGPVSLFGHSMGALVAFEVARLLQARGCAPAALYVSGRRPPQLPDEDAQRTRTDEQLMAELIRLGGTDASVLENEPLVAMILPSMRADYEALRSYRFRPGPPLPCPVVALTGDRDPLVAVKDELGWQEHTTGGFDLLVYPGGHFYLFDHLPAVSELLATRTAATIGAR
jgi:pyochelin biosynthetic protein PchC